MRSSMRRSSHIIAAVLVAAVTVSQQVCAVPTTLCDKLVTYQLLDPTSSTAAQAVMGSLFNRGVRGTEGSTTGGAIADSSMDAIWSGTAQYRENMTNPQPFRLLGASPNYKTSSSAKDALADKWRRWLGSAAVLGCTAVGYPAYSTSALGFGTFNQYQVHANMVISATQFAAFNAHLSTAFRSLGELQPTIDDDVAEFQALLSSFARNQVGGTQGASQICTAAHCPCITGVEGDDCDRLPAVSSSAMAEEGSTGPTGGDAAGAAPSSTAAEVDNGGGSIPSDTTTTPDVGANVIGSSSTASPNPGTNPSTGDHMSSTGRPCIPGVDAMCAAAVSLPSVMISSALLILAAFQFGF